MLAAAILVLLVIIATAYLTRTHGQRITSTAVQAAAQRDDNTKVIADWIAQEISDALFVWPVDDLVYAPGNIADANVPRLLPRVNARRYGVDWNFPYNFAPYHTVPVTNWPDPVFWDANARLWPAGPGNLYEDGGAYAGDGGIGPNAANFAALLSAEGNMLGNPGFGDARWLADTEPMRYLLEVGPLSGYEMFTHWRKMTNIARANNGWRIVGDISRVDEFIVSDLNIPVEQWLAYDGLAPWDIFGAMNYSGWGMGFQNQQQIDNFINRWHNWFGLLINENDDNPTAARLADYNSALLRWGLIPPPPNFLNLSDLNGNGFRHNFIINNVRQDTPDAEFVPRTARHTVSRVLADVSGDGFTDSFWFLAPTPARDGVRQIVAMRIVDNSAMLNANVATRFLRNDIDFGADPDDWPSKTRGHTPADIALVGQRLSIPNPANPPPNWNVGFYDNPGNSVSGGPLTQWGYNPARWRRHVDETGLVVIDEDDYAPDQSNRLDYWQRSARLGLGYQYQNPEDDRRRYRPFNLSDELELRMFHGNNHPWIFTRYEWTVQQEANPPITERFLRAERTRAESNEYLDQLRNPELVLDPRRKLTLYSGARNDELPPWLQWENRRDAFGIPPEVPEAIRNAMDSVPPDDAAQIRNRYITQSRRKLDLREPGFLFFEDYDAAGFPAWYTANDFGRLNLRERLPQTLLLALTNGPGAMLPEHNTAIPATSYNLFGSYYGGYGRVMLTTPDNPLQFDAPYGNFNNTRRLAAAFAANIMAYRSSWPATLDDAILLPEVGLPSTPETYLPKGSLAGPIAAEQIAYLPVEPQPFLVEAFVGHVYVSRPVPAVRKNDEAECEDDNVPGEPYTNAGQPVVLEGDLDRGASPRTTIAVVQIANPFDVPIYLGDYVITMFGNEVVGPNVWLDPATEARPVTAIFYSIEPPAGMDPAFVERWREFLDLDVAAVPDITQPGVAIAGLTDLKHPPGTVLVNVGLFPGGEWPTARANYDNSPNGHSVLLKRRYYDDFGGVTAEVVVDRFEGDQSDGTFVERVQRMRNYRPRALRGQWFVTDECSNVPMGEDDKFDHGYLLCVDQDGNWDQSCEFDQWVQWVRVTRAWGADLNRNGVLEDNERNPRFVFADAAVVVPTANTTWPDVTFVSPLWATTQGGDGPDMGDLYIEEDEPGNTAGGNQYVYNQMPLEEWFARTYYRDDGVLVDGSEARRPTFFNMNYHFFDPAQPHLYWPDKGWYGQYRIVDYDGTQPALLTLALDSVGTVDSPPVVELLAFGGGGSGSVMLPLFRHPYPMQMAMKNKWWRLENGNIDWAGNHRDFEQVGELLNVWLFGHEIDRGTTPPQTNITFSEFMSGQRVVAEVVADPDRSRRLWEASGAAPAFFRNAELEPASGHAYHEFQRWRLHGEPHRVNRLRLTPLRVVLDPRTPPSDSSIVVEIGHVINWLHSPAPDVPDEVAAYLSDARHAWPALPAGVRVLDAFTCDGPGAWVRRDPTSPTGWWNVSEGEEALHNDVEESRFFNANGFAGRMTPGLININTATPEVLRTLPHMTRIMHEDPARSLDDNPFNRVPWAMLRYRERMGLPIEFDQDEAERARPAYAHRGRQQNFFAAADDNTIDKFVPHMRGERGFASIGEVMLLTQSGRDGKQAVPESDAFTYNVAPANAFAAIDFNSSWRIDYPMMPERGIFERDQPNDAFPQFAFVFPWDDGGLTFPSSAQISTDTVEVFDPTFNTPGYRPGFHPDTIAEDAQESNLLFAGISNMITTRSDVFTVYFRVRSFRQNPTTGRWDATDPEHIIDDTRYIMLIDRSEVNRPTDRPKILYLERLPK